MPDPLIYPADGYGYDGTLIYQGRSVILGPQPSYPAYPPPPRPHYPPPPDYPNPYVPSSVNYYARPESPYHSAPYAPATPPYGASKPYHPPYQPESAYKATPHAPAPYTNYEHYGPTYDHVIYGTLWREDAERLVRYDRHAYDS